MGGKSSMRPPARLIRFRRKSQFGEVRSINNVKVVELHKEQCVTNPVIAPWPRLDFGNSGLGNFSERGVNPPFHTIS